MKKLLVVPALLKAHVDSYTRKDGTFVKEHDDKRQAATQKQVHSDAKGAPAVPPHVQKMVLDVAQSSAKPEHKHAAIDAIMSQHAAPGGAAPKRVHSDAAFDQIKAAGGSNPSSSSGGINYYHNGKAKSLSHKEGADGGRYVDHDELQSHLAELKGAPAAAAKPAAPAHSYDHPNVVGKADKFEHGDAKDGVYMHFAGKKYVASGKEGTSSHDGTPVRHFKELTGSGKDDGQHIWADHSGRVHADAKDEVKRLRGEYEAHVQKSTKKPATKKPAGPKPGHMDVSTLSAGHHLFDKNGQKVDEVESVEKHPMGGFKVNTRAGYSHMVAKDGRNDHGLTNKAPSGAKKPRVLVRPDQLK